MAGVRAVWVGVVMTVSFVGAAWLAGRGGGVWCWRVGLGSGLGDRDQREAGVADLLEQAVQCGLVDDETLDEGGAVVSRWSGSSPSKRVAQRDARRPLIRMRYQPEWGARSAGGVFIGAPWVVRCVHARSGLGEQASSHLVIGLVNFRQLSPTEPARRDWSRMVRVGQRLGWRSRPRRAASRTASRRLVTPSLA